MRAVLLLVAAFATLNSGCARVSDSWTHQELTAHLNAKGVSVRFILMSSGGILGQTGYYVPAKSQFANWRDAEEAYNKRHKDVVFCALKKTSQDARDAAGAWGDEGLAVARFAFRGDPAALQEYRAALR